MREQGLEDDNAASLAAAVLDEEAARQRTQAERDGGVTLPDDLLPGVGDEPMTLREAFAAGGKGMAILLLLLNLVDELPRTVRVLAPDIQRSLGISEVLWVSLVMTAELKLFFLVIYYLL